MSNDKSLDDSFIDCDETFSLYGSKKVTDTFKAQLKKIAASNYLTKAFSHVSNEKKNTNNGAFTAVEGPKENDLESESVKLAKDEEAPIEIVDDSPENSIELVAEITPKRSTRQSRRLRRKKGETSRELNNSGSINTNISCSKCITRGRNKKRKAKKQQKEKPPEVILLDSPEPIETEEVNPEVTVKVIWKSVNVKKFQIRKFQKLSYIFEQLSKEENIPVNKIILTFNNARVSQQDTPDSLNLQVYHFLDGGVLSESNSCQTPNSQNSEISSNCVILKFQDMNKKIVKIKLNKNEKLKVGMIKCSEQLEIPLHKIKFYFDGELLEPSETPASLGLENEEVIDIKTNR